MRIVSWTQFFLQPLGQAVTVRIAVLQWRVTWIALALILQSLNEIGHDWFLSLWGPIGVLMPLLWISGSLVALWLAFRPAQPTDAVIQNRWLRYLQYAILLLTIVFAGRGVYEMGRCLMMLLHPQYWNDGTSLNTNAAILLLQGRNPYTASTLADIVHRFGIQPEWTTPLRQGQFAGRLDFPSSSELHQAFQRALIHGNGPEFETKVSYPALCFLVLVPLVLFHYDNVIPFYLLSYLLIVFIAWKTVLPALRPWVFLLALANIPMWSSIVGGNLDIFCFLLLILAWVWRDQRWLSALCLGLAISTKQIAWFFVPFYAMLIFRTVSFKEVCYRLGIAGCLALLINLPFILWNPQAWLAGVLAPVADPMFPQGVGLVSLSTYHLLPYFPERVYTLLEGLAVLGMLLWYWRICRLQPAAAFVLAVIPLFFAWRSLPSYFSCTAYPLFLLLMIRTHRNVPEESYTKSPAMQRKENDGITSSRVH